MKGMVYRHVQAEMSEEWLITRIDNKYKSVQEYKRVSTTVTITSVVLKDGAKILKKKTNKTA